jgi:hypothetical protein
MPSRQSARRERRRFRPLRLEPLEQLVLPGFLAPLPFDAGSAPIAVVAGDFNGDGIPDLAVANNIYPNGTVSVLLGKGDGSFLPAQTFPVGGEPTALAVGDFNGDGTPDLAVADANPGGVSVLVGNGDGSFQEPTTYASVSFPLSVAVADFNGDGILDLAVVGNNEFGGAVNVHLGNGDGTFLDAIFVAVQDLPSSVAAADFNGDGFSDLAVVDRSGVVQVLLSNGNGTFQPPQVWGAGGMDPSSGAVGDFNGDGIPDLAVAGLSSDGRNWIVTVLLGTGDGGFRYADGGAAGQNAQSVAVGDFNGDGILDLTVANYNFGTPSVSVLLGNGDGSFQPAMTYDAGPNPFSVAVGDFNGDGSDDLAVTNVVPRNVSILLNDNAWGSAPQPGGQPPGDVRAAATAVEPPAAPVLALLPTPDVLPTDLGMAVLGSPGAVTMPVSGPSRLPFRVDADPGAAAAAVPEASRREVPAGQAPALPRRARVAGFFEDPARFEHLRRAPDLAPLRPQDDIRQLVVQLAAAAPED